MSKIGQMPIKFDSSKVKVKIEDGGDYHYLFITVEGPLGTHSLSVRKGVTIKVENDEIIVEKKSNTVTGKSYHGLYLSLIHI